MDFLIEKNELLDYSGNDEKIIIPDGVTCIGWGAFLYHDHLVNVFVPQGVTNIDDAAFAHCSSLQYIALPNSLRRIGQATFRDCKSLKDITIPDSVVFIDDIAFEDCPNLTIKCNPGSYAESWAKDHGFKTAPLMSRMRMALEDADTLSFSTEPDSEKLQF